MPQFNDRIDLVLYIIEIIGCLSFGTAGAFKALRKKADILGVWILTLIEVFGGGMLRDLIINQGPPHIFYDLEYLSLAGIVLIVSTFWFVIGCIKKTAPYIDKHMHDKWIYILDAFGIAVFTALGTRTALKYLPDSISIQGKFVYAISLGSITGVGGGMFRDVFVGEIPAVFRKHFYMTPCIIGSLLFTLLNHFGVGIIACIIVCTITVSVLRVLATYFKWNLPRAKAYNEIEDQKEANK